ncbi:hypothetical protein OA253_01430 [Alphaproteobacteria bacterium]|nr:hypothetical protein [Alphaproteobacteria bacterium]
MDRVKNNNKLITLIGMMGSGKTSCGSMLAKKLEINFIDIDSIIEAEENLKINQIFKKFGEKYFRSIEEEIIFKKINECLKRNCKAIISLGGGGFESKKTRKFLLNNSTVVWLNTDIKILIKRVGYGFNRPMIKGNIEKNIEMLLNERIKNYEKSHLKIDTYDLSIDDLCNKIIKGI